MTEAHSNVALLNRRDLAASKGLIAEDVVWHYANPNPPDLQGDHLGLDGVRSFLEAVARKSGGTFRIDPVSVTPVGDDLGVLLPCNTRTLGDRTVALGEGREAASKSPLPARCPGSPVPH